MPIFKDFQRNLQVFTAISLSAPLAATAMILLQTPAIASPIPPAHLAQRSDAEQAVNDRLTSLFGKYEPYRDFFFQLQAAVSQGDRAEVASLINYPLRFSSLEGATEQIENSEQFLANYDRIMTGPLRSSIANQKYEDLFARDQGVMIGRGEVWFSGICAPGSCQEDVAVKVITISQNALPQSVAPAAASRVDRLPDGNYRYWNGVPNQAIVSDGELLQRGGVLFRFRKQGNNITGDWSYVDGESICLQGQVNGNTVTGIAVDRGDADFNPVTNLSADDTFVNFGPAARLKLRRGQAIARQTIRYRSAILDLGGLNRINAGVFAPPKSCSI